MDLTLIFATFMNGVLLSGTYALIAIGLTLIFGVLRILNFAHGELIMAGGFMVWFLTSTLGIPFLVAAVVAILFVGFLAVAIERGLFRRTRENPFGGFIISLGLMYILQTGALLIFGSLDKTLPAAITGEVSFLGSIFAIERLVILPIIIIIIAGVWIWLERTRLGRAVRASIQDTEAASLQGISINSMSTKVMFIAGALAGIAGVVLAQMLRVGPFLGASVILKAFVVVIVGGMGSVGGTVVAAFLFGFLDSTIASLFDPRLTSLVAIIIMLIVLMIRPRGLFGRE